MFEFSHILPYSSLGFGWFMLLAFVLMLLGKMLQVKWFTYIGALNLITWSYLLLFFPKPIQFICFVLLGYLIYRMGRKYRFEKLLFPVLLHFLPLILMKITNVLPLFQEDGSMGWMSMMVQVGGLSFASFRMVQVYIDEKDAGEQISFLRYFLFVSFTPTLLIGPLDRYRRFNQDLTEGWQKMEGERISTGFDFLVRGLAYKFVLGQAISVLLLQHLHPLESFGQGVAYAYTYVFFLFFDFAGYSLLAIGFGKLLGIDVPENFNRPFAALNPRDFWQRWHKSLGDWLNDYFFKPIFKELTTRKWATPIRRQNLALLSTFTLMGCWNGFEIHFILSGFIFGCYSAIHNYYLYSCRKNGRDVFFGLMNEQVIRLISLFVVFNAITWAIAVFSGAFF